MAQAPWYNKRALWLTTWQALRSGKRSSVARSDYWQNQLSITEFIQLSELMLLDMRRICLGLNALLKKMSIYPLPLENYQPDNDIGLAPFCQ